MRRKRPVGRGGSALRSRRRAQRPACRSPCNRVFLLGREHSRGQAAASQRRNAGDATSPLLHNHVYCIGSAHVASSDDFRFHCASAGADSHARGRPTDLRGRPRPSALAPLAAFAGTFVPSNFTLPAAILTAEYIRPRVSGKGAVQIPVSQGGQAGPRIALRPPNSLRLRRPQRGILASATHG